MIDLKQAKQGCTKGWMWSMGCSLLRSAIESQKLMQSLLKKGASKALLSFLQLSDKFHLGTVHNIKLHTDTGAHTINDMNAIDSLCLGLYRMQVYWSIFIVLT